MTKRFIQHFSLTILLLTIPLLTMAQSPPGESYIVQKDDWLSKIAEKYYANLNAWPTIVEATNALAQQDSSFTLISNPNLIEPGQKLWIPPEIAEITPPDDVASDILPQITLLPTAAETLAFSPDDRLLALGSFDHKIQVWDTENWQLKWEGSHDDSPRTVIFSPDGQFIASAGFDGTARLWEAESGQELWRKTFGYWVYNLAFSADGRHLAIGSSDGTSQLVTIPGGEISFEKKHPHGVSRQALSPNAPWLAVLTSGGWGPVELSVWDTQTQESRILAQPSGPPSHSNVVFSPSARWLAASMQSGQPITIWETQIWPEVAHLETPPGIVHQLAFSPDGNRLAAQIGAGDTPSAVRVWAVPSWQEISTMTQEDVSFAMAFSPDGEKIALGLGQGIEYPALYEAQLWDVASAEMLGRMPHNSQVIAVAFSHNGQWLATGSPDGTTGIWEIGRLGD